MQALSTFLAKHILSECYGTGEIPDEKQPEILTIVTEHMQEGIRLYQEHLKRDVPRTVNWMMIETQLVIALGHMEDPAKSKAERTEDKVTCDNCGAEVVRNGTCIKCFNCGNSIECS